MLTENGVANIPRNCDFFFFIPEIYSQIPVSNHKARLHIFHCSKYCVQLVYHNAYNFLVLGRGWLQDRQLGHASANKMSGSQMQQTHHLCPNHVCGTCTDAASCCKPHTSVWLGNSRQIGNTFLRDGNSLTELWRNLEITLERTQRSVIQQNNITL